MWSLGLRQIRVAEARRVRLRGVGKGLVGDAVPAAGVRLGAAALLSLLGELTHLLFEGLALDGRGIALHHLDGGLWLRLRRFLLSRRRAGAVRQPCAGELCWLCTAAGAGKLSAHGCSKRGLGGAGGAAGR